jgi:hypothetical protein
MGSGRSVWACPRRGRGGGRGERRGGAPVSARGRGLAGQLCEDEVELKAGSVQAEQRWRGGATVSLSSSAFQAAMAAAFRGVGVEKEGKNASISSTG